MRGVNRRLLEEWLYFVAVISIPLGALGICMIIVGGITLRSLEVRQSSSFAASVLYISGIIIVILALIGLLCLIVYRRQK